MKSNIILVTIAFLLLSAGAFGMAAINENGTTEQQTSSIVGLRLQDGNLIMTTGVSIPIMKGLYLINYGDAGDYGGSVNGEFAYFARPAINLPLFLGVFLGADAQAHYANGGDDDPIVYVPGATGLIGTYSFGKIGVWVCWKYNWTFDTHSNYLNNNTIGGGVNFKL